MKRKKLYAVLTLVCFLFTLLPVNAFAKSEPSLSEGLTSLDGRQEVEMDNTVTFDLLLDEVYGYEETTTALYLWAEDADGMPDQALVVEDAKKVNGVYIIEDVTTNSQLQISFKKAGEYQIRAAEYFDMGDSTSIIPMSEMVALIKHYVGVLDFDNTIDVTLCKNPMVVDIKMDINYTQTTEGSYNIELETEYDKANVTMQFTTPKGNPIKGADVVYEFDKSVLEILDFAYVLDRAGEVSFTILGTKIGQHQLTVVIADELSYTFDITVKNKLLLASGDCGEDAKWNVDSEGILTINGTGMTNDYKESADVPWRHLNSKITAIHVGEDITYLGTNIFSVTDNVKTISIYSTSEGIVDTLLESGIYDAYDLETIYVSDENENWSSVDGVLFNKDKTILKKYPAAKKGPSYEIPATVKELGEYAFYNTRYLETITIPEPVTTIGPYAFSSSNLTMVTLPETLSEINKGVFSGCARLESITIPESVTSIGNGAFSGCTGLKEIIIPESVTHIGDNAFSSCKGVTAITLPETISEIANGVFSSCVKLESMTIPGSVTSIGSSAFSGCTSLKEIVVPKSVTNIGDNAFGGCTGATTITLSENITEIGTFVFSNCDSLVSIIIPEGVTTIKQLAFNDCNLLKYVTLPNTLKNIENNAFYDCVHLNSITIPSSVELIPHGAFNYCNNLKNIYVADENPSYYAIDGVLIEKTENGDRLVIYPEGKKETTYTIPENVKILGTGSIKYCDDIESLVVTGEGTMLETWSIYGCQNLKSLTIQNKIVKFNSDAIYECIDFEEINYCGSEVEYRKYVHYYPEGVIVNYIDSNTVDSGKCGENAYWAFDLTTGTLTISGTGAMDQYVTFDVKGKLKEDLRPWNAYCDDIKTVVIEEGITELAGYSLMSCDNVEKIKIASTVKDTTNFFKYNHNNTNLFHALKTAGPLNGGYDIEFGWSEAIPENAFDSVKGLENVVLPEGIKEIKSNAFYSCGNLNEVVLPESLEVIGEYAFAFCDELKEIDIPTNVAVIGEYAFYSCDYIERVILPSTVENIGGWAFAYCLSLKEITFAGSAPIVGYNLFTKEVIAYYTPDITWTKEVRNKCGDAVIWVANIPESVTSQNIVSQVVANGVELALNENNDYDIEIVAGTDKTTFVVGVSCEVAPLYGYDVEYQYSDTLRLGSHYDAVDDFGVVVFTVYDTGVLGEQQVTITVQDFYSLTFNINVVDGEGSDDTNDDNTSSDDSTGGNMGDSDNSGSTGGNTGDSDNSGSTGGNTGDADNSGSTGGNTGDSAGSGSGNAGGTSGSTGGAIGGGSSGGSSGGGGGGAISSKPVEITSPDDSIKLSKEQVDVEVWGAAASALSNDENAKVIISTNSSTSISAKDENGQDVVSFAKPIKVTVPIGADVLKSAEDKSKLTLALVTTDEKGNTTLEYVGGIYDSKADSFTAYTDKPGDYVLVEKSDIVKMDMFIDNKDSIINNATATNDVAPFILNNRTMVPVAFIMNNMGCKVDWFGNERKVVITLPDGKQLSMIIDQEIPGFGGIPIIKNDRTMVPIAYIADAMGAKVMWIEDERRVVIVK